MMMIFLFMGLFNEQVVVVVEAIVPPDPYYFSDDFVYNYTLSPRAQAKLGGNMSHYPPSKSTTKKMSFEQVTTLKRQQLNLRSLNKYKPIALGENDCLFVTDEECQEMDIEFNKRMIHTKNVLRNRPSPVTIQQQQQQNGGNAAATPTTTTTMNILVVLLQWEDHTSDVKTLLPREHYDALFNGNVPQTSGLSDEEYKDMIKTNSIQYYLDINSHGKFHVTFHVQDWIMTNGTESYYSDGTFGIPQPFSSNRPQLRQAFAYVLDQLELTTNINYTMFDEDDDGVMDNVLFLHSGYDASVGNWDCDTGAEWEDRIWSHATGPRHGYQWTSTKTGISLGSYAISAAYRGMCNQNIAQIGIITHEFLHTLGLPDLYDSAGKYNGGNSVGGLAGYDIMSNPRGQRQRLSWCGHLSPWSKMELNWIDPIEITHDGTYTARPSELHPDIYIIRHGYPNGEYLLIENRQALEYDERMWGGVGGILVYHIDTIKWDRILKVHNNAPRGFPGLDEWPKSGQHYPVALLQADGMYHLEKAQNNGETADFYREPYQRLGPGNGEQIATDEGIYPNTDSYAMGNIQVTGIVIENFRETDPGVWSFDVKGIDSHKVESVLEDLFVDQQPTPTTSPTISPTTLPTTSPTEAPTTSPTSGPTDSIYTILAGCVDVTLKLTTDNDVDLEESSYKLQSIGNNGNPIWNETSLLPNRLYDEDACINPVTCHMFYGKFYFVLLVS